MEKADVGKLAFVCILGVLGAVAITKAALTGDVGLSEGIIRWLLYTLACGLVINTQDGRPFFVIVLSSFASSLTLVIVITFKSYLGDTIYLSGAEISVIQAPEVFSIIMAILLAGSLVAITICSYARGTTLYLLGELVHLDLQLAKKVETILNRIVGFAAIAGTIVFSII